MQCWALVTDVIDDMEVKSGNRDDGTIYGLYSFSRKSGQAIAGGLSGCDLYFMRTGTVIRLPAVQVQSGSKRSGASEQKSGRKIDKSID